MARVDIFFLFLISEETLSAFHIEHNVSYGSVMNCLYYVEICFLHTHFDESFLNHEVMLNFFKCFFCIYWEDHVIFILRFINVVYHIDWFVEIQPSLHPWINPTWSWCMILLMCCWILFASILLSIFASIFISDIGL